MKNDTFTVAIPKRCFVFWLCGLLCLIFAFAFLLYNQIGFVIFAFVLGVILEYFAASILKKNETQLWHFITETSIFTHPTQTPMTPAKIAERLKQNFFSVTAYAFENYHGVQTFSDGYECHFFVVNTDAPDCKEAETFCRLVINTVVKMENTAKQFYICMVMGDLSEKPANEWDTLRKGLIPYSNGLVACSHIAYDVPKQTFYFADALLRIQWRQKDIIPKHICEIITQICEPYCNFHHTP